MECLKCGEAIIFKGYTREHPSTAWGIIIDILFKWHSCNYVKNDNITGSWYCGVCKSELCDAERAHHIIECLQECKSHNSSTDIKIGSINGVGQYLRLHVLFAEYPQFLVVNGIETDWIGSNNNDYHPGRVMEIIAKKIEIMEFHCLICGRNYETFPAEDVLLAHLAECVNKRNNARMIKLN